MCTYIRAHEIWCFVLVEIKLTNAFFCFGNRGYHEASIKSINELIRKHNIVAPLPVRKSPMVLQNELESCFDDMTIIIQEELKKRMISNGVGMSPLSSPEKDRMERTEKSGIGEKGMEDEITRTDGMVDKKADVGIWEWFRKIFGT